MKKRIGILLILVLVVGLFGGCSPKEDASQVEQQTDGDTVSEEANDAANAESSEVSDTENGSTDSEVADATDVDATEDTDAEEFVEDPAEIARFSEFLDRLALEALEDSPLTATFTLGDLEANGLLYLAAELDHVDLSEMEEALDKAKAEMEELHSFNYNGLTAEQRVNYQLVEFNLHHTIGETDEEFLYVSHLIQPSAGVQVNFPLTLMQIEFESVAELDAFVSRVGELPRLFDEVIAYEQERFEAGYALPGNLYDEVVEQIDAMLVEPEEFMMYLSFSDRVDGMEELSDEEKADYKANYLTLIADEVYPSFERLRDQAAIMNTSTATGSISEWADGAAYYEAVVDYKTSGELDVEGLEAWAGDQLVALSAEFQQLITKYPEIMDYDFETLLPEYETMDQVYDIVDQVYKVEFMDYGTELASENVIPEYLEEHLAAGFYFPVTTDGEDYGNMFLQADDYENITADTVMLYYHENIPGHHLYYSYIADSDEPLYRKMNEYLPYEEGWATYVQDACFDHMELPEGIPEFFALNSEYSNAVMVLLDIHFHYHGLSAEDVKAELVMMGYDEETADSVITRMISKPGEMIHYMYGEYKMEYFKDMYMELAGDAYEDKDFHDFILRNYGLPFYVVEEQLVAEFE